jgi:hypothetical protein
MRPMDDNMIATHLKNLDRGLARVEQILPTLATKEELRNLDHRLARVEQILPTLATKEELKTLATKEDLKTLATKEELREEGERSRRHMDVVAESLRSDIQLIAEHVAAEMSKRSGP